MTTVGAQSCQTREGQHWQASCHGTNIEPDSCNAVRENVGVIYKLIAND